jgi:hypothetical protein
LIQTIKIIGFIAFILFSYFGRQVYLQAEIAEELIQLPIKCETQFTNDCKIVSQQREYLLKKWDGNISNDFLFVLVLFMVYGGSSIYLASKFNRKAT